MSQTTHSSKAYITINKPREEVFAYWRQLSNLPVFMKHIQRVTELDEKLSEWVAVIPGIEKTLQWKSEITAERENEYIEWHSVAGSEIENAGTIAFSDAGKFGTELHVQISYNPPGGLLADIFSGLVKYLGKEWIKEDMKDFRRVLETGEIPTIDGQPSGNDKK